MDCQWNNFCLCCSYTGNDESIILYGDSQGCVNVLIIKCAGECLRYFAGI